MTAEVVELAGGLTLVAETMPEVRSAAVGFWVGTGSRDEDAELAGASHFLEHLLFKGTAERSARQIAETIDAVGGDLNAFTTKEYTAFYTRLLSDDLEVGLDVLCDVMTSPAFVSAEVEAERSVILEEIAMRADDPAEVAQGACGAAQFPGHPLGREIAGEPSTVAAMSGDDIGRFFTDHYRPANMVVSAAGRVDPDRLALELERRWRGPGGGSRPVRTPPSLSGTSKVVVPRRTEQAHLTVGLCTVGRHDPRRWAVAVLNHVIGGGVSSRLFQEIREKRGLAYAVYSEWVPYEEVGSLTIYAGTGPERVAEVLQLVEGELERAGSGISGSELDHAVSNLRADLLLSLEDSGARMGRIGRGVLLHGDALEVDDLVSRIEGVGLDDVAAVAAELAGSPRSIAVVGPLGESALERAT